MKRLRKIKGFSLIEVSISLVMLSSLVVLAITKYTVGRDNENRQEVLEDLKVIKAAVDYYVATYGYYPCPARQNAVPTDSDFGLSVRDASGNCPTTVSPAFTTYNFDATDFGANFNPLPYTSVPDVIQGVVPCKEIGLPQDCVFDPYGNRYVYAVVGGLTRAGVSPTIAAACLSYYVNSATAVRPLALLRVLKNYNGTDAYSVAWGVAANKYSYDPDYLLMDYGKDGIGAYTMAGTQIVSASTGGTGYIGDSVYEEINHDLHTGANQYYYFMPDNSVSSTTTPILFDDILVLGKNTTLDNKVGLKCSECQGLAVAPYNTAPWLASTKVTSVTCAGCTTQLAVCAASLIAANASPTCP